MKFALARSSWQYYHNRNLVDELACWTPMVVVMLSLTAWEKGLALPQQIMPHYEESPWDTLPVRRSVLGFC